VSGHSRVAPDGSLLGYRGVGRDVTEQRHAERALFEAKERLQLAMDGANLAEWHFDAEADELFTGDGWVRFLRHSDAPRAIPGTSFVEQMHPQDQPVVRDSLISALKGGTPEFDG